MPQRALGSPTQLISSFKYDAYLTESTFLKKAESGKRNKLDYE